MARAAPLASAFNAGELSPRMAGRANTEAYASGCYRMENFIPDIAGPAVKRAGTLHVAETQSSTKRSWLVRFELTADSSYMLEFGDGYIRFFADREPLLVSGVAAYNGATAYIVGDLVSYLGGNYYCKADTTGNLPTVTAYWYAMPAGDIYEIPSPYSEADLINDDGAFAISAVQSGDIVYMAHRSHAPRKLNRFGATEWTITEYEPTGGPFQNVNITATTVYASAATGSVTLIASSGIFSAAMVGDLFYIEQKSISGTTQWETAKAITSTNMRRAGGRNYMALNSATTGNVIPTHTEGAVYDGDAGVQWQFLDAGYGWVRITGYTSATEVTATVLSRLPDGAVLVGNATTKWAFAAWGSTYGYPDAVAFYLDRLAWARDQQVWMTVVGDYENMQAREAGVQLTDSAIALPIPSRRGKRVLWMETLESGLVIGTGSDEWLVAPASRNEPLGPLNISANRMGAIGSRDVPVALMFDSLVFCQRSGKRLRAMRYIQNEGPAYTDMNALADHVSAGFVSIAYVAEPYSLVFGTDVDGNLSACTFYPEQSVLGWARMPMDGIVECVQSLPAPDGRSDDLWLIVRRTINGATQRYVEVMRKPLGDDEDQVDAYYVDAGMTYDGASTSTITGLDYLEGETVSVLVDGAPHPMRVVSAGQITLQRAGSVVHVGLPYTAKLATMDIEAGSSNGTAQGKYKRIWRIAVRLLRTLNGQAGTDEDKVDTLQFRTPEMAMNAPPPLFTGDKAVAGPGGSDKVARAWFIHSDPLPATVVAFLPQTITED